MRARGGVAVKLLVALGKELFAVRVLPRTIHGETFADGISALAGSIRLTAHSWFPRSIGHTRPIFSLNSEHDLPFLHTDDRDLPNISFQMSSTFRTVIYIE